MLHLLAITALLVAPQTPASPTQQLPAEPAKELVLTGGEYDLAIAGDGYFCIQHANGERSFTRDGRFQLDAERNLVTAGGDRVCPPLTIPANTLSCIIGYDGAVHVLVRGETGLRRIGALELARFDSPACLVPSPHGEGLLQWDFAQGQGHIVAPAVDGAGVIRQGYVERDVVAVKGRAVSIKLGMEAHARGTEIELGEIAQVVGGDPALVKALSEVELGYAPAPGYSRVIRSDHIETAVAKVMPGLALTFVGQENVRVYPDVEQIGSEEIAAAVRSRFAVEFRGMDIDYAPRAAIESVAVPAGVTSRQIDVRFTGEPETSGPMTVPVDIVVDGTRYRTIWTSWDVTVWETRHVLARRVNAGEILSPSHFKRERVKVTDGHGSPLDDAVLRGSVALRDLAPGRSVTTLDVQRPRILEIGDSVFLRVRKGAIEAKVTATALEGGALGDRIRVQTGGGQELVATIDTRTSCSIVLGGN